MKRILALVLAVLMSFSCCAGMVAAAETIPDSTQESPTISARAATLRAGDKRGELRINYAVTATGYAESIGLNKIEMYDIAGNYVTTIRGSRSEGTVGTGRVNAGDVYFYGTPGEYYYAAVTVFATIGSVSDNKTMYTESVLCPE